MSLLIKTEKRPLDFSDFSGEDSSLESSLLNFKKFRQLPPANIIEKKDEFEIQIAVPGLNYKDFKITVENGFLSIRTNKKATKTRNQNLFARQEFNYNSFSRTFILPETVNERNIWSKYEDGFLKLFLKKK